MFFAKSKKYLKTIEGLKIFTVNGERIKLKHIEFTEGGNGYVYSWIPKNEIWIDNIFIHKPSGLNAIILHEVAEVKKMKKGMSYNKAHAFANVIEKRFRNKKSKK
jgi:hypothetical protein